MTIVLPGRAREDALSEIGYEATASASRCGPRFMSSRVLSCVDY